jgi:Fe-S oxidoreductase
MQVAAIVVCLAATATGVALFAKAVARFVATLRWGRPDPTRTDRPWRRTVTLVKEFLGHTRMAKLPIVAAAHWFVMVSFGLLFLTLVTAFGQLFSPEWALPLIGHLFLLDWAVEAIAWLSLVGILTLIVIRQRNHPRRLARRSRFFGSTFWQAYYVELTILGVVLCVLTLRSLEYAVGRVTGESSSTAFHYPLTAWIGQAFDGASRHSLDNAIIVVAAVKILISVAWLITISLQPTMGIAWHRFLAFFNIWLKREASGRTALGPLRPMMVDGKPIDFEAIEDLDEDAALGVGTIKDFTWKGLLDFTTCTECGRCQSQCPAWNTEKPLSPKLVVLALRDHAYAQAPYLTAASRAASETTPGPEPADVQLVQPGGVIDPDVLWSCTTCGACVEQCPVDIEHVDHIVDMRRHQVLIESAFPTELSGLFRNLEKAANPWGLPARARLEWAKDLPFDVPVVGQDVDDLTSVDYLFWVGCAGAYDDRAQRTTRAVAELLHTAGVSFAVLGDGETCSGDPARRAGNEFLFQMLAQANVETLTEAKATKVVVTCAHCFNTLGNEYEQLGGHYEVIHHTQLLNRLVRERRLVPLARPDRADTAGVASTAPTVTYHDPCYLGRHNGVYAPPRELLGALPGVELREMPRNSERSFCCGAGGARMWMEEKLGTRINNTRTAEAVATGADRIAIGCPFCRVMLSDGLSAAQSDGSAGAEVEVVDVAQMLLAAVRPSPPPTAPAEPEPEPVSPS